MDGGIRRRHMCVVLPLALYLKPKIPFDPPNKDSATLLVKDLIFPVSHQWDCEDIRRELLHHEEDILSLILSSTKRPYRLWWLPAKAGVYSTKSGYGNGKNVPLESYKKGAPNWDSTFSKSQGLGLGDTSSQTKSRFSSLRQEDPGKGAHLSQFTSFRFRKHPSVPLDFVVPVEGPQLCYFRRPDSLRRRHGAKINFRSQKVAQCKAPTNPYIANPESGGGKRGLFRGSLGGVPLFLGRSVAGDFKAMVVSLAHSRRLR
ncbi:hypothetical protein AXX17_AT3G34980 [Arabidopsis thaliana]|uniref:Uncharacterized protein n=1 Tax=Arabidopsis thaliana TaxID=3702 RepID=A0A178V8S0_ARATH|nr:hypothetical protein AXX17_AT3G34980 [Arabidopsis thaliana]